MRQSKFSRETRKYKMNIDLIVTTVQLDFDIRIFDIIFKYILKG